MDSRNLMLTPEVIAKLREDKFINTAPEEWKTAFLSPTVVRVESDEGSWIVKRSKNPRRELAVYGLFCAYGIPHYRIEPLGSGFLLYEDLNLPTLGSYLQQTQDLSPPFFYQLGCASMQSEWVGMKDRNLRNILIDQGVPKVYLIDFDSAFREDIFNRIFRPYKFYRYIVRRMFFDVLREVSALSRARIDSLMPHFRRGMLQEHARINRLVLNCHPEVSQFTWFEKICLRTSVASQEKVAALFERGYAFALEREKLSN